MARPTTPIDLSPEQSRLLQSIVSSREVPHGLVQRATIVLAASQGRTNKAIAAEMGLCEETVGLWRKRWVQGRADLAKLEGAPAQALARSGRCAIGRSAASGVSRHIHGGAGVPDVGGGLRKAAGTPEPLDARGTGARSHAPGYRGADFQDQRGSLFKIRAISNLTGPAIG